MPLTLSFGGAGKHFPFMMGIAHGLKRHFPIDWSRAHVHCISSGGSGAICLLTCSADEIEQLVRKGIASAQATTQVGHEKYYRNIIKSMLPSDAYQHIGQQLTIGQSTFPFLDPQYIQGPFCNQQALIEALYDSCRIPYLTGDLAARLDGGFSHQYALADCNTIVVTLKGKKRSDLYLRNTWFFTELLLPSPEKMMAMYRAGQLLVESNLQPLAIKIEKGLREEGVVFFHPVA